MAAIGGIQFCPFVKIIHELIEFYTFVLLFCHFYEHVLFASFQDKVSSVARQNSRDGTDQVCRIFYHFGLIKLRSGSR